MTMTECYNDILSRRSGEREALPEISPEEYRRRLKGAFFGRMAGWTLGAPGRWSRLTHMQRKRV